MANTFQVSRGLSAQELTRLGATTAGLYVFPESAGGAVTPSSGLTVAVAAIAANGVVINGTLESTAYAGGTVTADAADVTNPRRDLVYYDQTGTVAIKKGTATAVTSTTGPALPILDDDEIAVAELYIAANETTIDAGEITDRRQDLYGSVLAWAEDTTERTMSGNTITTLSTLSVNIPTTSWIRVRGAVRKSGTTDTISFGLTLNATSLGLSGAVSATTTDRGTFEFMIPPYNASYSASYHAITGPNGGAGAQYAGVFNSGASRPNATITSVLVRGNTNGTTDTMGVQYIVVEEMKAI